MAASGSPGLAAWSCGREEARVRERGDVRVPLPHCGALAAVVRRLGAAERQRGELLKRGGNGSSREQQL
jgi:hypothetical protein